MADEIPAPKITISVEHQKAIKAFLDTGRASKDLGKALDVLVGHVKGGEAGTAKFERTVSKLAHTITGGGATEKLRELAAAIEKVGGAGKLTDVQLENVRKRIESLKAAGGALPAGLANLSKLNFQGAGMSVLAGGGMAGGLMALGPAGVAAAAGLGAVAAAGGAITATLVGATKAVIEQASALKSLAAETQVDVEALQALGHAGATANVGIEDIAKSLSSMGKAILNAPEKFTALGLSIDKLRQMKPDEAFAAVAAELNKIENPMLKAAAATEVFGKAGTSVLPMVGLNLAALGDEARRFGLVMSKDLVEAGDELGNTLGLLTKLWDQLGMELGKAVIDTGLAQDALLLATKTLGFMIEVTARGVLVFRTLSEMAQRAKIAAMEASEVNSKLGLVAPGGVATPAAIAAAKEEVSKYTDETLRLEESFAKLGGATAIMEGRIKALGTATADAAGKGKDGGKKWSELGDEARAAAKKIAEANKKIAASNTLMESKAGAEAMAHAVERAKEQTEAIEKILQESAERRKKIDIEIVASRQKADDAEFALKAKRAADIVKLEVDTAADQREAARMRMSDIDAIIDQIEEQRQETIRLANAETDASAKAVEAQQDRIKAADALAEALKRAARQQELLNNLGKLRELFGELIGLMDQFGISAESGAGKLARAGEQYVAYIEQSAQAAAAFERGDILGAIIGQLKAVGSIVSGIKTLFAGKPEWQKVGEEIGRRMGVGISQGLAETIAEDSKRLGDRIAASLLHLPEIFKEAGGVEAFGLDKATALVRDLFVAIETGKLTTQEAGKAFEEAFGAIAEALGDGRVSAEFLELIALEKRFGLESKAVAAWQEKQANATIGYLKTIVEHGLITEKSAAGVAAALLAQYDALLKSGKTVTEALAIIGPQFASLKEKLAELGIDGGPAFEQIAAMAAMAADEIAGPLLSAVGAVGPALNGLYNQGILTQEMFSGLTATIGETHAELVAQGYDGKLALAMMQPSLQEVWELQQDFGYAVDDATQALLDEAIAAGRVGDAHRDANERAAAAMELVADTLIRIARFMGVDIPEAAKKGAKGIEDAFDGLRVKVDVDWEHHNQDGGGNLGGGGGGGGQGGFGGGFAHGGVGYFGAGELALLHGWEAILPLDVPLSEMDPTIRGMVGGGTERQERAPSGVDLRGLRNDIRGLRADLRTAMDSMPLRLRDALLLAK